ncbi:MAG: autotransporter-associated beta strand repeat-containing protein, partial [Planctomycetes bacterium]|nr:autotransporter-associated beta strand repeat-containing protein [Planctomycetota bacterium]
TLRITGLAGAQAARAVGGTLDLNNSGYTFGSVLLADGAITSGTLTSAGLFDLQSGTVSAVLAGTGGLTKSTAGTVTLSGANTYAGATTISGGVVSLGVAETSGTSGPLGTNTAAGAIVLSGGTLQFSALNQFDYSPRFSTADSQAYNIDTNGQSVTLATALTSNGGSLAKSGLGTLTLTQDATFSGAATVSGGTLALGNGGTAGGVAGTIALSNAAGLVVNRSNPLALGGVVSGTGSLTKVGGGTLSITAANTYSGTTTLAGGVVSLGVAETAGTSGPFGTNTATGAIVLSGGTLQYTAANRFDYSSRFSTAANQAFNVDTNGQSVTFAALPASSGGSLAKSGAGKLAIAQVGATLAALSVGEAPGSTSELQIGSNVTVTNAVTLGASSGTARFTALPSGAGNVTAVFTNGITVNGGGQLLLAISSTGGSHVATSSVSGNVTVAGGYLEIARFLSGSSAGSASMVFNNGLAMSSGTINVQRNGSVFYRTTVTGPVNITGGAVVYDTGNQQPNWFFNGTSIVMRPDTLSGSSGGLFALGATTSATATFGQGWSQTLSPRGTGVKTVSMDSVATPFLNLRLQDDDVSGTTSLRLGSNLTFSNLLEVTTGTVAATTQNFAIDTNGYTATFSSQPFTVVAGSGATNTVYDLVGSGTLSALGFTLNTGSTTVNVGPGLTLVASGSNRVNTLSGSGTIDPTSTFRYAALGTGTLVSTRAIGNVEATSGTLRITGLAGAQAARAVGGTLDLNNSGYTFGSVLLADGAIT